MSFSKKKIKAFSREFKKKRAQFTNETRETRMGEYLELVSAGMEEIQNLATNTQTEIFGELGLTENSFRKYQQQLGMFMQ